MLFYIALVSEWMTIQRERAGACTDMVNSQTFPKQTTLSFNVKAPGFDLTVDHIGKVLPLNSLLSFLSQVAVENLKRESDLK